MGRRRHGQAARRDQRGPRLRRAHLRAGQLGDPGGRPRAAPRGASQSSRARSGAPWAAGRRARSSAAGTSSSGATRTARSSGSAGGGSSAAAWWTGTESARPGSRDAPAPSTVREPALMSAGEKCGRIRPTRTSGAGGHPADAEKCAPGVRARPHSMPTLTSAGGHPADTEKCGRAAWRGVLGARRPRRRADPRRVDALPRPQRRVLVVRPLPAVHYFAQIISPPTR